MSTRLWGKRSLECFMTLHPMMQQLMDAVLIQTDIKIQYGLRDQKQQDSFYKKGTSRLKYPNSKHNKTDDPHMKDKRYLLSDAVDITPYPKEYQATAQDLIDLSKIVFAEATRLGIKIRWGGDFNGDGDKTKNDAWDKYHYELRW
jgi:peptidoglycan L-alanyl-D-glutamate endopeptidase CwlK